MKLFHHYEVHYFSCILYDLPPQKYARKLPMPVLFKDGNLNYSVRVTFNAMTSVWNRPIVSQVSSRWTGCTVLL